MSFIFLGITNVSAEVDPESLVYRLAPDGENSSITKLENGKFIVNIPLIDGFKDIKDNELTVYYINEKGEKEEHIATVKDGIATFETNHFSTYILAEKIAESNIINPNTSDNILIAVAALVLSMAGIVVTTKCIKK